MKNEQKPKSQLAAEVKALRQQVARLESSIAERKQAEETLRESEERYRQVVENSPNPIFSIDREGIIRTWNRSCEKTFHYDQDIVGQHYHTLLQNAEDQFTIKTLLDKMRYGQSLSDIDMIYRCQDGEERFTVSRIYPVRDQKGEVQGYVLANTDITERVRAEKALQRAHDELEMRVEERTAELTKANEALRVEISERVRAEKTLQASEEYTRNVIESSLDMIITSDMERRIVEFNRAAEETFGYRREEVIGEHVDILYANPKEGLAVHETAIRKGRCVREILDRRKNGEVFPAYLSASILRGANNEMVGIMGIARDITERVWAEQSLAEKTIYLDNILRSATEYAIATTDLDFHITYYNPLAEQFFGYTAEKVVGKTVQEMHTKERVDPERLEKAVENVRTHGEYRYRVIQEGEDGTRYLDKRVSGIYDPDGELVGFAHFSHDVTERLKAEEALRESEKRYRTLITDSPISIVVHSKGKIVYANPVAVKLLSATSENELLGKPVMEFVHPDYHKKARERIQKIYGQKETVPPMDEKFIRMDGKIIDVEVTGKVINFDGKPASQIIISDITERKRAEELARAQRDLALAIGAAFGLDETLRLCLETAIRISDMDCGGIYLVDETSRALDLVLHKNLPPDFVSSASHYEADSPNARLVMAGRPVYSEHLQLGTPIDKVQRRETLRAIAILPVRHEGRVIGCFNIASHTLDEVPAFARTAFESIAAQMGNAIIRVRAEEALQARTRELALLNSAGRAFISSLELGQVLTTVLDQVRRIIEIVACSVWLVDPKSGDLICREVASPRDDTVRGWRLAPGQGLVGWVFQHRESLNVPNIRIDKRHFKEVDKQTGLQLRSILSVPLRTKSGVFGVLQLVDELENRFSPDDARLAESLAALAAIAIENARLYEQTQQDAAAKTLLLQEVNHRVKNNLAAITGILYIERRHAQQSPDRRAYAAIMDDLVNRIKGLSTVHQLLSDSNWSPLPLSELARQVINSALQGLPPDRRVLTDVSYVAPVVVTPKTAHNLAIVINELTTNVVKYAAPLKESTQITVRIAPEPDEETVLFEFRDDGPGFPAAVLRSEGRNVGMHLIENTVRHTLRGEITLHNDNGAVVTIQFAKERE